MTTKDKIYYPETIKDNPLIGPDSEASSNGNSISTFTPEEIPQVNIPKGITANNIIGESIDTLSRRILGSFDFGLSGALQIGRYVNGTSGDIKISPNGIVGRNSAGDTTFAIDGTTGAASFMGTISAGSVVVGYIASGGAAADINANVTTISGGKITTNSITADKLTVSFIQVGGAAGDVNSGATTISGGKITANSITADRLNVSTLSAISSNIGTITAGSITADVISAGTLNVDRIPSLDASKTTSGTFGTDRIPSLNVNKLTAGTLYVGGNNEVSAIVIRETTISGNARLSFEHNSRIWEDSSADMGLNAIGGDFRIYGNSTELAYFGTGNLTFQQHLHVPGIDFQVGSQDQGSIDNVDYIAGHDDIRFFTESGDFKFLKGDWANCARIERDTGKIHSLSDKIDLAGTDKTAIVSTDEGYKALYCAESPEVWFFDFCKEYNKLDPLFEKVTEGDSHFLRCETGEYLVFRRRKGHAGKRFEGKTALQFLKNEKFLRMAK